ncbi:mechanosensitive ion channel domain-containing protein [uncultured Sunxiuqinia sp.]|uniref:mechanosensitive ion channel family protein n=1 Tax=uncultured Sunxiuqinia sp. TaxID=1573825 RepID=UPI002AA8F8DE|nr:mechanosensitive ion channel domain-containing protein [uncultured Sunxiuqinia sp.]
MNYLLDLFRTILSDLGVPENSANHISIFACLLVLALVSYLAQWTTRIVLANIVHQFVQKTKTQWDDFMVQRKVFSALAHLSSALIIYYASGFSDSELVNKLLYGFSRIYFIGIFTFFTIRTGNAANDIYQTTPYAINRPIKGYIQLFQILIFCVAIIFVISVLIDKTPLYLLGGLGAIAAVLLLVFKDTILSLVASIQLSANKMLKPGDWIAMPSHNADGTVIDISLNTVKVQNWDKTITTIPTYALVSESFNNWIGMEESGGRRIKRSVNLDMRSVRFCDKATLEKLSHFYLLKDYLEEREKEIKAFNNNLKIEDGDVYNGRRQTNLGIFRRYLENYLRQHPMIHQELTFLVRHLQPSEKGLPLEFYVFSKDQNWAKYEAIQADIMDHILAILPEFGLRVFQNPSGYDISDYISQSNHSQKNSK